MDPDQEDRSLLGALGGNVDLQRTEAQSTPLFCRGPLGGEPADAQGRRQHEHEPRADPYGTPSEIEDQRITVRSA